MVVMDTGLLGRCAAVLHFRFPSDFGVCQTPWTSFSDVVLVDGTIDPIKLA